MVRVRDYLLRQQFSQNVDFAGTRTPPDHWTFTCQDPQDPLRRRKLSIYGSAIEGQLSGEGSFPLSQKKLMLMEFACSEKGKNETIVCCGFAVPRVLALVLVIVFGYASLAGAPQKLVLTTSCVSESI
jgi:hypothetical protein